MKAKTNKAETSLVLRVCRPDFTSKNNFQWPSEVGAVVTAPDWKANDECGNGLHGWLYGQGDCSCVDYWQAEGAKWMVLEVASADIVMLGGKCKFPQAKLVFVGAKADAAAFLVANETRAKDVAVIGLSLEVGDNCAGIVGALGTLTGGYWATLTGGDRATLTGGDGATLTGGYRATLTGGEGATLTGGYGATLTGGDRATLTGGNWATLTGGYWATLTGGDGATLTGGYGATLTGGDRATLTGGDRATLTGGDGATLTGGYGATLTGGDRATLTGGYGATLTGGDGAELRIRWYDNKAARYRTAVAYVGEDGIKANTKYRLDDEHKFVEVPA